MRTLRIALLSLPILVDFVRRRVEVLEELVEESDDPLISSSAGGTWSGLWWADRFRSNPSSVDHSFITPGSNPRSARSSISL